jgi:hypothetical protein
MPRHEDGTLTSVEVAELMRVTYRRLDHWLGAGYLTIADRRPGSGSARHWHADEVARARVFAALVHGGVEPKASGEAVLDALIGPDRFEARLGVLTVTGELP